MSATDRHEPGHGVGTVAARTPAGRGAQRRVLDQQSAVPGWPRLLSEEHAATYVGLSVWSFRELWQAGQVEPVRIPRPDTAKHRRRRHINDTLRKLLFDVRDLDRLVDGWKTGGGML